MRPVPLILAALALPLTLAAGCGVNDEPAAVARPSAVSPVESPAGPSEVAPTSTTSSGACAVLTLATTSSILDLALRELAATPTGCVFAADDGSGLTVTTTVTEVAIDPAEYAAGTRDLCEDEVHDVDAGEDVTAFACTIFDAPQGFWFSGTDAIVVRLDGTETSAKAFSSAVDLLPYVTAP